MPWFGWGGGGGGRPVACWASRWPGSCCSRICVGGFGCGRRGGWATQCICGKERGGHRTQKVAASDWPALHGNSKAAALQIPRRLVVEQGMLALPGALMGLGWSGVWLPACSLGTLPPSCLPSPSLAACGCGAPATRCGCSRSRCCGSARGCHRRARPGRCPTCASSTASTAPAGGRAGAGCSPRAVCR